MTEQLTAPPVLSTPETHVFEDPSPPLLRPKSQRLTDEEIHDVYEISRTASEVRGGGWKRVALQFPDGMLHDAPRVFEALQAALGKLPQRKAEEEDLLKQVQELEISPKPPTTSRERLFILADTSYGACCVDEIAAEHVDADIVVHYGRSCLSPTARLPVIYVFTTRPLPLDPVVHAFETTFPSKDTKIILMADVTYSDHIPALLERLSSLNYSQIFAPTIVHDPSSPLPNRTIPEKVTLGEDDLKEYNLFHISDPPPSLLLTLSSRLQSLHIYSTSSVSPVAVEAQTSRLLNRRYALLTSLTTCSVFGILINTLSVKNYLSTITTIQSQIAAVGKKSYTFVVGKVNAAKVANFSEIGGWVVIGCWESSLIESTEFYRPIITPFELKMALMSDDERVWTGEWNGDFTSFKEGKPATPRHLEEEKVENGDWDDEEESAPPEYDLRAGRYVSHSRPMHSSATSSRPEIPADQGGGASQSLLKRAKGDLAMINGAASPGAEYLRTQRTWQGLGSDFEIAYEKEEGAAVEEGRSGVARGYTVGDGERS